MRLDGGHTALLFQGEKTKYSLIPHDGGDCRPPRCVARFKGVRADRTAGGMGLRNRSGGGLVERHTAQLRSVRVAGCGHAESSLIEVPKFNCAGPLKTKLLLRFFLAGRDLAGLTLGSPCHVKFYWNSANEVHIPLWHNDNVEGWRVPKAFHCDRRRGEPKVAMNENP